MTNREQRIVSMYSQIMANPENLKKFVVDRFAFNKLENGVESEFWRNFFIVQTSDCPSLYIEKNNNLILDEVQDIVDQQITDEECE